MHRRSHGFFYRNGLSIFAVGLFLVFWAAQAVTGWADYNDMRVEEGAVPLGFLPYLMDGDFIQVTFENWESEFLAIASIVILSVWLRQYGSPESKPVDMPHSQTP